MTKKCFSLIASRNWCLKSTFSTSGLRSTHTDLGDGTTIHCWVPKTRNPNRPDLLLIHGFGANAMWQWGPDIIPKFVKYFNIYVPDLVFFGESYTTRSDRSDTFQAQCVYKVMEMNSVKKMRVVGLSYGGFVAYSLAAQFKEVVERVVICCAGVCLEEKDVTDGLFVVKDLDEAADMLVPQTPQKMKELMRMTFVKPPVKTPNCILVDFIDEMNKEHIQEKRDLVHALAKDRKLSELPKISQPTMIIWGEKDRVFPLELAYRLKRHLGDNADLVVLKNTGHAYIVEKTKEFYKHLKTFLLPQVPPIPSTTATTSITATTPATVTTNGQDATPTAAPITANGHDATLATTTVTKHHDATLTTTTNGHDVTTDNTSNTTNSHNPHHLQNNNPVAVTT